MDNLNIITNMEYNLLGLLKIAINELGIHERPLLNFYYLVIYQFQM
jgi:hypothetical protein